MKTTISLAFASVFCKGQFTPQQHGLVFMVIFLPIALALSALMITGLITINPYLP